MGFLDRLLGRQPSGPQQTYRPQQPYSPQDGDLMGGQGASGAGQGGQPSDDDRAIGRYRYLLRTAPPEAIEQVHAEAFAQLTPEQRSQVLAQLSQDLPEAERPRSDDPGEMARAATRAEMRQPGYLQQSFGRGGMGMGGRMGGMGGGMGGGIGMGGMIGGSLLGTIAGVVVGSAIADSLFGGYEQSPEAAEAGDTGGGDGGGDASGGDGSGGDAGGNAGVGDAAGYTDPGYGDASGGSDFGGGDFGGGDFGGGDF